MKRRVLLVIVGLSVVTGGYVSWMGVQQHIREEACKQREAVLSARVVLLEQRAQAQLPIGTSKDSVIHFFTENGFHPDFLGSDIQGTVFTSGCAPLGCGTDDALIGIRVSVGADGTVVSKPVVISMYTSCA